MDNLIGKKLDGRYLIESLIGVGGMANVYKGRDVRTGNQIAVKVLKEEFLDNEELVRRFKNKSKAISILNHPNIVKVYDVSVTDQLQNIVMEYIDGITLKEYLKQRNGALTWKKVVHFATQVLSALDHAHSKGIVHRDVKPQNIMLQADGSIKITGLWHCTLFPCTEPDCQRQGHRLGSLHQPGTGQRRPYRCPH